MRPARKGPENLGARSAPGSAAAASMRPARKGPENLRARRRWTGGGAPLQ